MATPTKKTSSTKGRKRVRFSIAADAGSKVYIAGSFNKWNPKKNPLKEKDGVFVATMLLEPGSYEYKFVVDGNWCVDPDCNDWAPNDVGSLNSVVIVKA